MSTVRKVKSKANIKEKEKPAKAAVSEGEKNGKDLGYREQKSSDEGSDRRGVRTKKACHFCKNKLEPRYWDAAALRKFTSDRGRILPRGRSGACAKHQRRISREIKRARLLALLPFSPQI